MEIFPLPNYRKINQRLTPFRKGFTLVELAVVIIVIGILMSIAFSILSSSALFKSSKSEAKKLAAALMLARNAAVKSNTVIYFELNLDEEKYRAYRLQRSEDDENGNSKMEEKDLIESVDLAASHSILGISTAFGGHIEEGLVKLRFLPSGLGEEAAIYLGPQSQTAEATVIYKRYEGKATVHPKEVKHELEKPDWQESELVQ